MKCLVCADLARVLDSADSCYKAALSATYYLVSTEIAARMQVDMERAKIALSEHSSSCPFAEPATDTPFMHHGLFKFCAT
jgi:hypothetical protein